MKILKYLILLTLISAPVFAQQNPNVINSTAKTSITGNGLISNPTVMQFMSGGLDDVTGVSTNGSGFLTRNSNGFYSVSGSAPSTNAQSLLQLPSGAYVEQNVFSVYNDALKFPHLRSAIGRVMTGNGNGMIVCAGDSGWFGTGSSPNTDQKTLSPCYQLAAMLKAKGINVSTQNFIGNGPGTNAAADGRLTVGSGWTSSGFNSAGGQILTATAATSSLAFVPGYTDTSGVQHSVQFDTCAIYYAKNVTTGSFDWDFDGGAKTTVNTNGANAAASVTVAAATLATHTLNLNYKSGGAVFIIGWSCYDSTKPTLFVLNAGWPGSTTANWAATTVGSNVDPSRFVGFLSPDLVIWNLGANDMIAGVPTSTVTANYATNITNSLTGGSTDVAVYGYSHVSPSDHPSEAVQEQYIAAIEVFAAANFYPFIDEFHKLVSYANIVALGWNYSGDTAHLNGVGQSDEARSIYDTLNGGGVLSGGSSAKTTGVASGITGDVQFNSSGDLTNDPGKFWWDAANHRLGIGTTSPSTPLDINAGASTHMLFGQDSGATTFNMISLNGNVTDAGGVSIAGGAVAETRMFLNVPTSGSYNFRVNAVNALQVSPTAATLGTQSSLVFPAARSGTFICTGGGTITISNANMAAASNVVISLSAQAGTITTPPAMKTVTPTTGFSVLCGATDTSTYNYVIMN